MHFIKYNCAVKSTFAISVFVSIVQKVINLFKNLLGPVCIRRKCLLYFYPQYMLMVN